MPYSSRKVQEVAKRLASQESATEKARLAERLHHLSLQFQAVQLQSRAVHTQYRAVQRECLWLQQVVNSKQEVIEELLPYYPHPLTPKLLYAIELY
jgi:hypothetical protein